MMFLSQNVKIQMTKNDDNWHETTTTSTTAMVVYNNNNNNNNNNQTRLISHLKSGQNVVKKTGLTFIKIIN